MGQEQRRLKGFLKAPPSKFRQDDGNQKLQNGIHDQEGSVIQNRIEGDPQRLSRFKEKSEIF